MLNKVLPLEENLNKYLKRADERAEKGDYISALAFCFSALSIKKTPQVHKMLAQIYSDMGLYELANQYWFYYLDKTPEKNCGLAYEELGINHFYMGNTLLANYYFNKKVEVDGFIEEEGVDKEILDYFEKESQGGKRFRIIYPLSRADFSDKIAESKRKLAIGDFVGAIKNLKDIPVGVKDFDKAADQLSLAYFLSGDIEKAIEVNKRRLNHGGDKLSIYCNLSSMYHAQKMGDKSEYYYSLALSEPIESSDDEYRLATVSLEQKQEEKGLALLEKVLKERSFDVDTEYLLALVKINLGRFDEAEKIFRNLIRINPYDFLWNYYHKLALSLLKGDESAKALLPVSYEMDIPRQVRTEWVEKVKKFALNNLAGKKKPKGIQEVIDWGVRNYSGNDVFAKACILSFGASNSKNDNEYLKSKLIEDEISTDIKILILYLLVMKGITEKISLVISGVFVKAKPNKLKLKEDMLSMQVKSAYALCFSKAVIMGLDELPKIAKSAEKVYKTLSNAQVEADEGEIATLIIEGCNYPYFKNLRELCSLFGASEVKVIALKSRL